MDFIPPYLMAFFVAEFVLVMQFLWKYIDEIIGKGISFGVLLELIFYFAVRIIPEAVPVTILISSVMVFGNLAEKYEISSLKSAGISLTRIMAGGVALAIFTALFSLLASNYLKPRANYKFKQRLLTVTRQKATLNIEEGVFSQEFKNFTINVGKKMPDGEKIEEVLIYDNTAQDKAQINMLSADRGKMYSAADNSSFIMELEDGEQYRELKPNKKKNSKPFIRTKFEKWTKNFDMSDFDVTAQSLNSSRSKYDLLNSWQLREAIDSFDRQLIDNQLNTAYNFDDLLSIEVKKEEDTKTQDNNLPDSVNKAIEKKDKQVSANKTKPKKVVRRSNKQQKDSLVLSDYNSFIETFEIKEQATIIKSAKYKVQKTGDSITKTDREKNILTSTRARYVLRFNQQFSWALICIVFLFIGAPLGSIVRKGGYGFPLLISIIFFMMFIVLNIMGEKLNRTGEISPILAAWLPNIVLIPVAIYISYKALNDSSFSNPFKKIFRQM
jgi:lipopolysaccharide export system permease protein